MMVEAMRELIKRRNLLYMITRRDISIKYKQSIMGFMWAVLMPALLVSTGIIVRLGIAKVSGIPLNMGQISAVAVKSVPWAFFVSSIRFSTGSLIGNGNLINKIRLPREIFPISAVLSQLFDFFIASCALVLFLLIAGTGWSIHLLWVLPLVATLILFTMSVGILLSAANLFLRDVKYIVEVITSFAIFFTPVFYDADLAGRWKWLLYLNPVTPVLEGLNSCIVHHRSPDIEWFSYSIFVSFLGMFLALAFFNKLDPLFAESL